MAGVVVRRVIPSDNSCLFNAVGYVMEHDKNKAAELRQQYMAVSYWMLMFDIDMDTLAVGLGRFRFESMLNVHNNDVIYIIYLRRYKEVTYLAWSCLGFHSVQVIAATVASDPDKYNEAFLGKPNKDYCAWILDPEKWGGAIELSILSKYYGREIAAYDIQTLRCDLYGQEERYPERVMLIYDGLHYDALAMSPLEDAPEEFDQTIFTVDKDRSIGPVEGLALNLVKDANRKRSYTDTANFTLRCGICQTGLVGQKEAMEHAKATGHVNFQEFR